MALQLQKKQDYSFNLGHVYADQEESGECRLIWYIMKRLRVDACCDRGSTIWAKIVF